MCQMWSTCSLAHVEKIVNFEAGGVTMTNLFNLLQSYKPILIQIARATE